MEKTQQLSKTKKETPENSSGMDKYVVPENEKHVYHVLLEKKIKIFKLEEVVEKRIQKMKPKAFKQFQKMHSKLGYTLTILHTPENN